MNRKKYLSVFVVIMCAIIIFGLCSCNSQNKIVELRFMGYNQESSRVTYLKFLEDNLPNLKITYEYVSLDEFNDVLMSQLKDGSGPDIIEVGGETRFLANSGYLLDITDQPFVKRYAHSGLSAFIANDKIYATPLQSWYEGIFYNKKIFDDNGISVPRSLDQFIAIHHELEEKGIKPQTMGAASWEPMMKQSIGVVNNEFYSDPANKSLFFVD
jgi:raffinose/stachyose/melibiose transport system substrate-binding protein